MARRTVKLIRRIVESVVVVVDGDSDADAEAAATADLVDLKWDDEEPARLEAVVVCSCPHERSSHLSEGCMADSDDDGTICTCDWDGN